MTTRRIAALQACLLLVAMFAHAASRSNAIRIKVLDSQTRSAGLDNNGVPLNCDELTFDAYCRSTSNPTATLVYTLLVQEGDGAPFRIRCTADSKFSRCVRLPIGETFDARRGKHGITVYYEDDKGKVRNQLYTLVAGAENGKPAATATPAAKAQASAAPTENTRPRPTPSSAQAPAAPVPRTAAPAQNSTVATPVPSPASTQEDLAQKVKCNFSSTPPGAEISVDWRYVGNTPSEIGLSIGTHVVTVSMPGYAEWKRELTVAADSVVNVTATLEKTQP